MITDPEGVFPPIDDATARDISRTLLLETRHYVAPLWWARDRRDATSLMHNASCFFIEIGASRFGVTAYHVLDQFVKDAEKTPGLKVLIGNTTIPDWPSRVIGADAARDVVTFAITDEEFDTVGIRSFKNTIKQWPRKPPDRNRGVLITGYAGVDRRILDRKSVEFLQTANCLVATSIGPEEIEIQIAREFLRPIIGKSVPSIMKDLGGYSGAPVLVVSAGVSEPFWIGGIVINQVPARSEDDFVVVIARRTDCIMADGSLRPSKYCA